MKIALIAMSGIRVCDKELLELGLTLPGFVERSKVIASLPSLGLLTLAGMTPAPHEVRYFEISDLKELDRLPSDFDLAAISSFSAQIKEAYAVALCYKELGVPVVLGGLHATAMPEEASRYCDAVVIGEGESVWREILVDAERKSLRKFYQSSGQFNFEEAPMPAYELLDISKYNRLTVQTSRGCPLRCDFCASSILLTKKYKQKPAHKVLAEIDKIKSIWKRPFIEFADDNTFVNRPYWRTLLPELEKRNVRWFTETDVSVAEDAELLSLMQSSGCAEVLIGLESPNRTGLNAIEMKSNWKFRRWEEYKEAVGKIQSHGIRVNACFIVGLDGHGPEIFEQIYDFAEEVQPFDVQITLPTPFPGTPFYERLRKEGRLLTEEAWEKCTLFDLNFEPSGMSGPELRRGFHQLGERLYGPRFTALRREHFEREYKKRMHEKTEVMK